MLEPINLIQFKRLKEKWNVDEIELKQIIDNGFLPVFWVPYYYPNSEYLQEIVNLVPVSSLDFADYKKDQLFFRLTDVYSFEKEYREFLPFSASLYSDQDRSKTKYDKILPANSAKKLRPSTEDKIKCQRIAKEVWKEYLLDIKYMKMHPEIIKIARHYSGKKTLHDWLSEVAPEEVKQRGRRSRDYEKKQLASCKKLGIEALKK